MYQKLNEIDYDYRFYFSDCVRTLTKTNRRTMFLMNRNNADDDLVIIMIVSFSLRFFVLHQ